MNTTGMEKHVLIAAGGRGTRMQSAQPKQFIELYGKPVLLYVLDAFFKYDPNIHCTVILPDTLHNRWKDICLEHDCQIRHHLVEGGPTRFHSVKNGLKNIPDNTIVAVHDAVRPLVSQQLIARLFDFAQKFGNAIPVIESADTVRKVDHAMSTTIPRKQVRLVQTPQCFHASPLKRAYTSNYKNSFTDDACVLEAYGERLYLVDGEKQNIKITTLTDLLVAECLLKSRKKNK